MSDSPITLSDDQRVNLAANADEETEKAQRVQECLDGFSKNLFYDQVTGKYLRCDGDCISVDSGIKPRVRVEISRILGEDVSPRDRRIIELLSDVVADKSVVCTGAIAGKRTGEIVECAGLQWLVTSQAKLVAPKRGSWKRTKTFLNKLLGKAGFLVVCARLKAQLEAVMSGEHIPGPMLTLTGETGDGKSLALAIFGELMGGRVTNPMAAWGNDLAWNDGLLRAESLFIDDSNVSDDYKSRKSLSGNFKETIYGDNVTIQKRHTDEFTLRPVNWVVMACNFNGTAIRVVPPPEEPDLNDKLILIRTRESKPWNWEEGDGVAARKKRRDGYYEELPAFAYYLLNTFKIPDDLPPGIRQVRGGLLYQDPEVLEQLYDLSPYAKVEAALEDFLNRGGTPRAGAGLSNLPTSDIRDMLTDGGRDHRLPNDDGTLGRYLGTLADKNCPYVARGKKKGNGCRWNLSCPPAT